MNEKQPIVDTDIWVFLVQSKYHTRVLKKYSYLYFSDAVAKEIYKWDRNTDKSKQIATLFRRYQEQGKARIIRFEDFDTVEQLSIEHQLSEYGLKSVKVFEKNKGEFVSVLYALHKSIERMKTNDRKFKEEISGSVIEKITIVNWDDILNDYSSSIKERAEVTRMIKTHQSEMRKEKLANQDPRWEKLKRFVVSG